MVDDSATARRMLVDALSADPDLEVVGTASNGIVGLLDIAKLTPDIVTLDVEMPEMSGLEVLKKLRRDHPTQRVIMFSALTEPGAMETIEALSLGAQEYVTKPANADDPAAGMRQIREQLTPKIKGLCGDILKTVTDAPVAVEMSRRPVARTSRIDMVAIGISTGGPNALDVVIPALPTDFPVPVLIVQHMPSIFTRHLAERLSSRSAVSVREATDGEQVQPGAVRIAPGDWHMVVERECGSGKIRLHRGDLENSCRPSADVLFRSVAAVHGSNALAVIMTGMGQDGLDGCRQIRDAGGTILAQDEATSVVWGMPGSVIRAGLASIVLPLSKIAGEINRRSCAGRNQQD